MIDKELRGLTCTFTTRDIKDGRPPWSAFIYEFLPDLTAPNLTLPQTILNKTKK